MGENGNGGGGLEANETCAEKHKNLDKINDNHGIRLTRHGDKIDALELELRDLKKDTSHLQEAIKALKSSIDTLILELSNLKLKPLEKYEKVAMYIVLAAVSYFLGKGGL